MLCHCGTPIGIATHLAAMAANGPWTDPLAGFPPLWETLVPRAVIALLLSPPDTLLGQQFLNVTVGQAEAKSQAGSLAAQTRTPRTHSLGHRLRLWRP